MTDPKTRRPLPREPRWSRESACYQLKSLLALYDVSLVTGEKHLADGYHESLRRYLSEYRTYLPGAEDPAAVMDRLRRAAHEKALAPKDAARFAKLRERAAKKLVEEAAQAAAPSAGPDEALAPDPTHYELPDEGGVRS